MVMGPLEQFEHVRLGRAAKVAGGVEGFEQCFGFGGLLGFHFAAQRALAESGFLGFYTGFCPPTLNP